VHVLTAGELYKDSTAVDEGSEFPEDDPEDLEELSTFRENYCELGWKPCAGAIQSEFRVLVDGKIGGSGKFTLIERSNDGQYYYSFHATCDAVSQEVHDTGCLFFDKRGRPRIPSLKEAMMMMDTTNNISSSTGTSSSSSTGSLQKKDYFLYLEEFTLNPEYRVHGTNVGAQALRSLLLDDCSPLKDKWSVAIYIADPAACFTEEDKNRSNDIRELFRFSLRQASANAWHQKKDWEERLRTLAKLDLRQFLRSGFLQATDSLQKSTCLYAFAVPAMFRKPHGNGGSIRIMSHEDATAATIVDRTDLPSLHTEMSIMDSDCCAS
jgi:hypothetical protein